MPRTDSADGGADMSMELVAAIAVAVLALLMAFIDMAISRRENARESISDTTSVPVEERRT